MEKKVWWWWWWVLCVACVGSLELLSPLRLPERALSPVPRGRRTRLVERLSGKKRGLSPKWALDVEALPEEGDYVVAFVNPKSGGRRGKATLRALRAALHESQVVDLTREGAAERALALLAPLTFEETFNCTDAGGARRRRSFRPRLRGVCCGGDGTVGWVLSHLDARAERDARFRKPPLAVFPLGTGNDLARVLGWGGGVGGDLEVPKRLAEWAASPAEPFDRWTMTTASEDGRPRSFEMLNYLGVGVDAEVALEFHRQRTLRPRWFASRLLNKLFYVVASALRRRVDARVPRGALVRGLVDCACDGAPVAIPESARSLVVANVNSYMGGGRLWFDANHSTSDAKLEVLAFDSVIHLARVRLGLARPHALAQGENVTIAHAAPLPVHVDGEPWALSGAGTVAVAHAGQVDVLTNSEHMAKGWQLDAFSRHLIQLYEHERDIYSAPVVSKRNATPARPRLF